MLLLEGHWWRGFHIKRDLFYFTLVLGFVSVSINGERVSDMISEYRKKLDELRLKLKTEKDGQSSVTKKGQE